jgi:hypothetical protein
MRYRDMDPVNILFDSDEEGKSDPINILKPFDPKVKNPYFYEAHGLV